MTCGSQSVCLSVCLYCLVEMCDTCGSQSVCLYCLVEMCDDLW